MTSGHTTVTATSALSRETRTKETPETAETHVEKRLQRLWVRTGENTKRLRSTSTGRWWLLWVSGGRKWVVGSSKAVNVACSAVFDPSTNSALSRLLGSATKEKKTRCHSFRSSTLDVCMRGDGVSRTRTRSVTCRALILKPADAVFFRGALLYANFCYLSQLQRRQR
jgi:hypothetical protein